MTNDIAEGVFAVTVTYGDRTNLISRTVKAALSCGVDCIIVVMNGIDVVPTDISLLTEAYASRVNVLKLKHNTGSAGGFYTGIAHALKDKSCKFLWLLDDDNEPAPNALTVLLHKYRELSAANVSDALALFSFRSDRQWQRNLLEGVPHRYCAPPDNSFCGFHVREVGDFISGNKKRILHRAHSANALQPYVELPIGPYGGMLLSRELVTEAGLPDRRFVVYCDDTEFTMRIRATGARMFLIRDSVIKDLESSWSEVHSLPKTIFGKLLESPNEMRVLYTVRNSAYIDRYLRRTSKGLFLINCLVFLFFFIFFAIIKRHPMRAMRVFKALNAGLHGRFDVSSIQ